MKHSAINPLKLTLVGVFSVMVANQTKAQSQNWWRVNGNNGIGVNSFIGTTDNKDLNFRTNNVNRIGISGSGDITINGLAGSGIGLMMHDANGKLISLPTTGQGDKVLMDNGQFVPISNFNTGWTLSGNKTLSNVPFVGINTPNPTEALTVNGNALVFGTLTTNGLSVLHKIEADTIKSGVRLNVNGTLVLGEDGGYNGIASRNDELRLNSKPGVDRNVIISANNNGNVGIGVVNPQEKLEVIGNVKVNGFLKADSIYSDLLNISKLKVLDSMKVGTNSIWIGGVHQPTNSSNHIYSTTGPLVLQSVGQSNPSIYSPGFNIITNVNSGRFGIGTPSPETKLHVRNVQCQDCPLAPAPEDQTVHITLEDQINNAAGQTVLNTKWRLAATASQDRFFITKTGHTVNALTITPSNIIGIGTNTPGVNATGDVKLDVNGDARFFRSNNPNNYLSIGYNTANAFIDMGGDGKLNINYYSGKDVAIGNYTHQNGPSNLFVSGNVAIGATSNYSNTALQVQTNSQHVRAFTVKDEAGDDVFRIENDGKIVCTEAWVRLKHNFPDYVFDADYNLMSLDDLKLYIEAHHRLPNMPSATEVDENGADLGEINRILVEKVEELTLYTLELNKKLELLKQKIEQLDQHTDKKE